LAPARGGERSLQSGGRKLSPQLRRARNESPAEQLNVAAERVDEFPSRSRSPACVRRAFPRRLAGDLRIAVHMIRCVWHRVEPTSSLVREGTRTFSLDNVLIRIWLQRSHIERARLVTARPTRPRSAPRTAI
jgi:hypothetical protein